MGNEQKRCYWRKKEEIIMNSVNEGMKRGIFHLKKKLNTITKKK